MSGEDLYSGTESMRSGLELDADKVEAFFRENLQYFDGNAEITQFKEDSPTQPIRFLQIGSPGLSDVNLPANFCLPPMQWTGNSES